MNTIDRQKKFLFVPELSETSGLGHFIRSLRLAEIQRGDVYLDERHWYRASDIIQHRKHTHTHNPPCNIITTLSTTYDFVILDMRTVTFEILKNWQRFGCICGIDVGGEARSYIPYLIDTLPNTHHHAPNIYKLGSSVPQDITSNNTWPHKINKVLIYPSDKEIPHLNPLLEILLEKECECTLVIPNKDAVATIKKYNFPHKITIMPHIYELHNMIHAYDLYITHFGLSAFESLAARVPVILLNPTHYHQNLSAMAQFPVSFLRLQALCAYIRTLHTQSYLILAQNCAAIPLSSYAIPELFDTRFATLDTESSLYGINPWRGIVRDPAVYRDEERTVFRCAFTRQWYQIPFSNKLPSYDTSYFFAEYTQQYGKTYLEDMPNISKTMNRRMKYITKLIDSTIISSSSLLVDIGCAYGAMLLSAQAHGIHALGIDIHQQAIKYITEELTLQAVQGDVRTEDINTIVHTWQDTAAVSHTVCAISAWFVLEHFNTIQIVLDTIQKALVQGGILALAVPNARGISARLNFERFIQQSPLDHVSLFTPHGLSKVLKNARFKIRKCRITGHHPERFPLGKFLYPVWWIISRIFGLGDTFEIYAEKT